MTHIVLSMVIQFPFIDCLYLVFCKSTACEKLNQDLQVDFDSFANELNFFFLL